MSPQARTSSGVWVMEMRPTRSSWTTGTPEAPEAMGRAQAGRRLNLSGWRCALEDPPRHQSACNAECHVGDPQKQLVLVNRSAEDAEHEQGVTPAKVRATPDTVGRCSDEILVENGLSCDKDATDEEDNEQQRIESSHRREHRLAAELPDSLIKEVPWVASFGLWNGSETYVGCP